MVAINEITVFNTTIRFDENFVLQISIPETAMASSEIGELKIGEQTYTVVLKDDGGDN